VTDLDFGPVIDSAGFLASGLALSLAMTVAACVGGMAAGTVLALFRLSPIAFLRRFGLGYVVVFRAVPLLLILFWSFFMVPVLFGRPMDGLTCAVLGFVAFEAAYFCEIIRAGIEGVSQGQRNAGLAIGLRPGQNFRLIILPTALRRMLPIITTQTIVIFQDTSVLSILALHDFTTNAEIVVGREGRAVEVYLVVAAVYLAICSGASYLGKQLVQLRG
jgi:glutamate/aspartate transport system permease protein